MGSGLKKEVELSYPGLAVRPSHKQRVTFQIEFDSSSSLSIQELG